MSSNIEMSRSSGILLHISSLPSSYGFGSLGEEARRFVDFLQESGQSWWQVLPIGPTGYGDSPYQSFSSFAGNPYMIDLDYLKEAGLLTDEDLVDLAKDVDPRKVHFGQIYTQRYQILRKAYASFQTDCSEFQQFCRENSFWLDDYALFMAIKEKQDARPWQMWEEHYKFRKPEFLHKFAKDNATKINFYRFLQYEFFQQWLSLKAYTHERNISFIGDLPFYVAADSADTWANPKLFSLQEDLTPLWVGGCPPDDFSADGQLWGNPCYEWSMHAQEGYQWWLKRFRWLFHLFDRVRIDHFRGFASYWRVSAKENTAKNGSWQEGPKNKLFAKMKAELGPLPIIAEDLGYVTKEVTDFRKATGFPGMKVLLFAFNPDASSIYLPHNIDRNSVVYIGTHDSDTVAGWLKSHDAKEVNFARKYLNLNAEEGENWGMIRGAMTCVAQTAIFQMQDLLNLDNSCRMNCPGSATGNWSWRMLKGELTQELKDKLYFYTKMAGRLNKKN